MFSTIQLFFNTQMTRLMNRDYQGFVSDYDFPLALHTDGALIVYATPTRLIEAMTQYRAWLERAGVAELRVRINAMDIKRSNRFRVWVTIDHVAKAGRTISCRESIYFMREKRGRLLIEMVQCTETPGSQFMGPSLLRREQA